jgi:6-pyruvoyltetrahydropterin/6-carboxytetrahydropterin synthase
MIQLTKIFRFETAHAIHQYNGKCRDVHGHSYELHVTVSGDDHKEEYIEPPGFIMDFKDLKQLVTNSVIEKFDHKVILSSSYLADHPELSRLHNLVEWKREPSAENMVVFIRRSIDEDLPAGIRLKELKLYETADSYAEWCCE